MRMLKMMWNRFASVGALGVMLVVTGCGNYRQFNKPWPATVSGMQGFSDSQQTQIRAALEEVNTDAKKRVIEVDGAADRFPVTIQLRNPWPEAPTRAGYATMDPNGCVIEISTDVMRKGKEDYLRPVLWHELGHCAGLQHDPKEGEVMYKVSEPFSYYSSDAFTRFWGTILHAASL